MAKILPFMSFQSLYLGKYWYKGETCQWSLLAGLWLPRWKTPIW